MFHAISYKGHYIHFAYRNNIEKIEVRFMKGTCDWNLFQVKSYHAAKCLITRLKNKGK